MVVPWKAEKAKHVAVSFSAPSVEPYGGSTSVPSTVPRKTAFSAPSVEPYGGSDAITK